MKTLKRWLFVVAAASLCGCFQVQDELTVQPDGSGTVKLTLHSSLPEELLSMLGMASHGGGPSFYPPISEGEARRFFPAKDFTVKTEQQDAQGRKTLVVEASFKDLNRMLASPYGRAHQLTLKTNGQGQLKLQALSGGGALAQAAQFKPDSGGMPFPDLPGLEEAQKLKDQMRFEFRVTLPGDVTQANGARDHRTVSWSVERAKAKDDADFAAQLSTVLEATCSTAGLTFAPVTPPRLGLLPFSQLVTEKATAAPVPDTNRVLAAAKFVPCQLQATRTLDLSGEGGTSGNEANLIGALLLPAEFAPQRWGQPRLEEALDAKGQSLLPKADELSMGRMRHFSSRHFNDDEDDNEDEADDDAPKAAAPKPGAGPKPHFVSITFKAPEWKLKQIAKLRGTIELQYLGGTEVVKLSNAVPAALVMDMSKLASSGFNYSLGSERGQVSDARLKELGYSLRVQMAMAQSGATIVSLQTEGRASLVEAQVFDAEGQPWPTTLSGVDDGDDEQRSCQLMVAGQPKPPFSLALVLGGVGASVQVPFRLENVPVGEK